jgi:hypothetical protein
LATSTHFATAAAGRPYLADDFAEQPAFTSSVDQLRELTMAGRRDLDWKIRVRTLRVTMQAVASLLETRRLTGVEPVAALILREQPGNVPLLGLLWAKALGSAPHRRQAIEALVETLRALRVSNDVQGAVVSLGLAISKATSVDARQRLRRDLIDSLRDCSDYSRFLINAFVCN